MMERSAYQEKRMERTVCLPDAWRIRLRLMASLLGLVMIGSSVPAASQVQTSSEERFFRIEWEIERREGRGPVIVGSVSNHYVYSVQRVQLQAQVFDQAGQMIHEALGIISDIPPGRRGTFRLPLPAAGARYVVTVQSFQFGAGQSP